MGQIFSFSAVLGVSRKKIPSNRSARLNSGGSLEISLLVQTTYVSLVLSDNQLRSDPNNRAPTPLSPPPDDVPASAFSTSSSITMHGDIASAIRNACRTFCSV